MANLKNTIINDTGFLTFPSGSEAQRPNNPQVGYTRMNTDSHQLEIYDGTEWKIITYVDNIVTNGLVLHLDAGNINSYPGTGTTWTDLSGNDNDGTLINGPTFDSSNGGSISFDGSNDYGSITNVSELRPATELTVSMWAKADLYTTGWNRLFGQDSYTGAYLIFLETGGQQIRALHHPNGSEVRCNTNYTISTTQFTHIVFTFKMGDAIRSYFNGSASTTVGLSAGTFTYNTSNPFLFGHSGASAFDGNIAQILIYNRALTPTEILQNYNADKNRFGL